METTMYTKINNFDVTRRRKALAERTYRGLHYVYAMLSQIESHMHETQNLCAFQTTARKYSSQVCSLKSEHHLSTR